MILYKTPTPGSPLFPDTSCLGQVPYRLEEYSYSYMGSGSQVQTSILGERHDGY